MSAELEKIVNIDPAKILVFDLETTGLNKTFDEILQISIVNGLGNVLFSSYVKPKKHKSWDDAQRINGISPEMVSSAPTFKKIKRTVQYYFNQAKVIAGYNSNRFDIPFIENAGIVVPSKRFDVREEFCSIIGKYYTGTALVDCATYFGHSYNPHDALNDAQVTALCLQDMIQRQKAISPDSTENLTKPKQSTAIYKHRRFHPFLLGLILVIVSLAIIFIHSKINPFGLNISIININAIKQLCFSDLCNKICSGVFVVGIIFVIWGIIKFVIRAVRWIINQFRRIFH